MKKMNPVEERRKMFEDVAKKKRLDIRQLEKEKRQREQMNLLRAEQMRRLEKERLERINRAREQGWKNVIGSGGGGDVKAPFFGGGGAAAAPQAAVRASYEHYHSALDQLQKPKSTDEREVKHRAERQDLDVAPKAAVSVEPSNGPVALSHFPDGDAVKKELKRLELVSKQAFVDRHRGHVAAERARQVEEFWQRKQEAMQNKARAEGHMDALYSLAAIYGGRPSSAGGGKARNKEEQEEVGEHGRRGSNEEAELRRKKIEALKAQANARAAVLKEELERKRREADEREKKAWEEHLAARGFKNPNVPCNAAGSTPGSPSHVVHADVGGSPVRGQSHMKPSAPAISMTSALENVGADAVEEIRDNTEDPQKTDTSIQDEKRQILKRLNQNLKAQEDVTSTNEDIPGETDDGGAEQEDHVTDRRKWQAEGPVIPLAQFTIIEDTIYNTIGGVIKLDLEERQRREWGKSPPESVVKILGEAQLQLQTELLQVTTEEPEDIDTEVLEDTKANRSDERPVKTASVWNEETKEKSEEEEHAVDEPDSQREDSNLDRECSGNEDDTEHSAGDAPKALFQRVPLPYNIVTPNVSAQSSFDDSLPPRSRSASPAKTKGKTALLIGLSTGLFDANNPKMLRTCSLPDLSKLFKTLVDVPSVADLQGEEHLEIEDIEDEPIRDADHSDSEDTMFGETDRDLQELQASMEQLLREETNEDYCEAEDNINEDKNKVNEEENNDVEPEEAEVEDDENQPSSESAINEEWHSDDSNEDFEYDEGDSVFGHLEELRLKLEQEIGFENFIEVYNKIKAIHEDEDENIDTCSTVMEKILGSEHLHLYPRILRLVMADGAYQEDNDE
ncbi:hypothetical protein GDO78_011782 [Eleutherodactylus coqui]|nr:hypothetical protein GDO78_011782 [Eleutherodactylus coqui]